MALRAAASPSSLPTQILNGFYYHIDNFIFLAPTGEIEGGLTVADYDQGISPRTRA
jgi:hypothetical protein